MEASTTQIRRARTVGDYEECVRIQQEVWNFSNPADYASLPLLRIQNRHGGSVLVAEDTEGRIRGFAFALLCRNEAGKPFWWSHMTAVREGGQGAGVGFALKRDQRTDALRAGISEIRWTFDPLQALNAHFNIRKLGTIVTRYEANLYGTSSSPLHHSLPTDRLETVWNLQSDRVAERIEGTSSFILRDFDGIVRALENQGGAAGTPGLDHRETPLLVEIPVAYPATEGEDSPARRWQTALSDTFTHYFDLGYEVKDFILIQAPQPHAFYVLER